MAAKFFLPVAAAPGPWNLPHKLPPVHSLHGNPCYDHLLNFWGQSHVWAAAVAAACSKRCLQADYPTKCFMATHSWVVGPKRKYRVQLNATFRKPTSYPRNRKILLLTAELPAYTGNGEDIKTATIMTITIATTYMHYLQSNLWVQGRTFQPPKPQEGVDIIRFLRTSPSKRICVCLCVCIF